MPTDLVGWIGGLIAVTGLIVWYLWMGWVNHRHHGGPWFTMQTRVKKGDPKEPPQ